jgi:ABC-2 type transport system ATP-binding protein
MEPVIKTNNLSKKYGTVEALTRLNLNVAKGEVLGYLGPNGAGKTTTIRLFLGLIKPTGGWAKIFGLDSQNNKVEIHKRLAYVPGEAALWPSLTGQETLYLLGKIHGQIDTKYLKLLTKRFQFDTSKKVRAYSHGNRQKLNIIAALMTRADLLILDEPTNGLDPLMEQTFRECVVEAKDRGQTVFLSSHILDEVEALCDRVAILSTGKLVEVGTLKEMRHLSALTVEATFDGLPPKVDHLKGVTNVHIVGHQLNCQIHGSINELFSLIVKANPKTLLSREPSLEELFLSLYGDDDIKNPEVDDER